MVDFSELEATLSYIFQHKELLHLALTHRSASLRSGESHNERLEFLGDSVLSLAMSDLLMQQFPDASEGTLSENARVLSQRSGARDQGNKNLARAMAPAWRRRGP